MPKWIYPYETIFGDVVLRLTSVALDGDELPLHLIDNDFNQVRLLDADRREWDILELSLEVVAPGSEISQMRSDGRSPKAFAILQSGPANTRLSVPLAPSELEPGRWTGDAELDRSSWFGRITIRSVVVDTVDGVPDRIIGTGTDWTVRLDDQPAPPINGSITITWDDFTDPKRLPALRLYKDEPAFLHLDSGEPVLYLNSALPGLEPLLQDRRRRSPAERALHDQTRVAIASETWAALFNSAILAIDEDADGNADWPAGDWQRTALEIAITAMYPDRAPDDALAEVAASRHDAGIGATVQQALLPVVSSHVRMSHFLKRGIAAISSDSRAL